MITNRTLTILTHKNIRKNVCFGRIATWADEDTLYELHFNADGTFDGVVLDGLNEHQIKQLESDCKSNKGFFSPDFSDTDVNDYDDVEILWNSQPIIDRIKNIGKCPQDEFCNEIICAYEDADYEGETTVLFSDDCTQSYIDHKDAPKIRIEF